MSIDSFKRHFSFAASGRRVRWPGVVREAFGARRKMLRRALEPGFGARAAAALQAADIAGTRRAEELSVADFARLTNALADDHACAG
jgi:16S rRNA A1518/A1519 N6-dimethyltransferase RsmA/KsgA/DIM1 with predicted DNA glycosylase/AP lyase activity